MCLSIRHFSRFEPRFTIALHSLLHCDTASLDPFGLLSYSVARALLIDTDTASDDAVALIMALRSAEVRVVAITTVAGNVGVQQATRNALYTVELCGANVPVYAGAEKPLLRAHQSATWFHGRDGFGDHNYPPPHQCVGGRDSSLPSLLGMTGSDVFQ